MVQIKLDCGEDKVLRIASFTSYMVQIKPGSAQGIALEAGALHPIWFR